jgi:hypothetical protein
MNQRAKDGLYQQQERTPVDGRSKVKLGIKVMEKTMIPPPSVAIHVEKKETNLEIVQRNGKGFLPP